MFLARSGLALRDALDLLQRLDRHRREGDRMDLERLERSVLERIAVVARLRQVAVGKCVLVDDEDPARRQVVEVRASMRRGS